MKYVKGVVLSRRLGRSLGINLLPDLICSEDCIYCECGTTRNLTLERKEYAPTDQVISELDRFLKKKTSCRLYYILWIRRTDFTFRYWKDY